jgi:PST family polysaccharide transporter
LTTPIVTLMLTWWVSDWRPQRPRRSSGTRPLLSFGANLTASSFLWSLARGADGLLIGRFYGAEPLGLYSRAGALLTRPIEQLVGPVATVLLPTLSRLQPEPERYRRVVLQVYEGIAVSSFLFSGLLLALARPLTLVVLGAKWEQAAPIFAGFTLVALYTPVASVASWLLMSQGRGRDFLVQSLIGSSMTVLACLVGLPFGPVGVATSYSGFCLLVSLPLTYHIAGRRGPVSARDLWTQFFRHLPLWAIVCGATWLARYFAVSLHPLAQLFICGAVGLIAGVSFICAYPPSRQAALGIVNALSEFKKRRHL